MESITIKPLIYILRLQNEKYYVGITYNLNMRLAQHYSGTGARFTKENPPISIYKVINSNDELKYTLLMMNKFGYQNVRGSYWCKSQLNNNPLNEEKYANIILPNNKKDESEED